MQDHEFGLERDEPVVKIKQVDPEQELLESIIQEEQLKQRQKEAKKATEKRLGLETLSDISTQEEHLALKILHDIHESTDKHTAAIKYNTYFGNPRYLDLVSELGCEQSTPMWVHYESWVRAGERGVSRLVDAGFSPVFVTFLWDTLLPLNNPVKSIGFGNFQEFILGVSKEQPNVFLLSDDFQVLLANILSQTQVHCALIEGIEFFGCHATAFVYECSGRPFPFQDTAPRHSNSQIQPSSELETSEDPSKQEDPKVYFTEVLPLLKSGVLTIEETKEKVPSDRRARKAYFRRQQQQELHLMNYSKSLGGGWFTTGSVIKSGGPDDSPADSTATDITNGKVKGKGKVSRKEQVPKKSKADIIREQNTARIAQKAVSVELEKLVTRLSFCASPNEKIETLIDYIASSPPGTPKIQAQVYLLEVYSGMWAESFHAAKTLSRSPLDPRYGVIYAIGVVRLVYDLRGIVPHPILENCMASLGFSMILPTPTSTLQGGTLTIPNIPVRKVPVGMSFQRFQLAFCGGYMDRGSVTEKDPRIPFKPEPWQKDLLDIVDKKESVLVVAPTSAGKTFVSYYAMKKVLLEDDTGVIVYVAPNKALVHQVLAEVYSRFGKKNYATPGMRVFGSYLPEYNKHPFSCQVLVTIPSVLEAILLSAEHTDFVKNIRYIILDEVHCIASLTSGKYLERIIALNTAPVVALSATIGNPDDLHQKIQQSQKVKTHLIISQYRHSYLYHYEWNSRFAEDTSNIGSVHTHNSGFVAVSAPKTDALTRIHPLSGQQTVSGVSIDNIAPCDALALADAIPGLPRDLSPEQFFRNTETLIDYPECREYVQQLLDHLSHSPTEEKLALDKLTNTTAPENDKDLLKFAVTLNHHSLLPSIMFAFDRTDVNYAFTQLLHALRSAEASQTRTSDPKEDKKNIRLQKLKERIIKKTESSRIADKDDPDSLLDPEIVTVDNKFSFVKTGHTHPDIDNLLRPLAHVDGVTPDMIEGLRRGFGVHHDGVHTKYRQVVETLFRTRHLRIVFSTETLAIGINMPCRSTVFLKDSTSLNPVYYRQMSGRSGRRGFDLVGHVIFYDIPRAKTYRLMTSNLPNLVSNSPDSVLLTLRKMAIPGVSGVSGPDDNTRFLQEHGFIQAGHLLGISGFAGVSSNEEAVINFTRLLSGGCFHEIIRDFDPQSPKEVHRSMMVILAELFSDLRWPLSSTAVLPRGVVLWHSQKGYPVNAYILNFWEHPDNAFASMTLENLIGTGDVWGVLKQFADILSAITKALEYRHSYITAAESDSQPTESKQVKKTQTTKTNTKVVWNDSESDPDSVPDDWDADFDSDTEIPTKNISEMSPDTPETDIPTESLPTKDIPLSKGTLTKADHRLLAAFKLLSIDFSNKLKSYNFAGKNVFIQKKK